MKLLVRIWAIHDDVEIHWAALSLPSMLMMYVEERRSADMIEIHTGGMTKDDRPSGATKGRKQ